VLKVNQIEALHRVALPTRYLLSTVFVVMLPLVMHWTRP
jgi:hypothetical protein